LRGFSGYDEYNERAITDSSSIDNFRIVVKDDVGNADIVFFILPVLVVVNNTFQI
jgi:hypothetical protein